MCTIHICFFVRGNCGLPFPSRRYHPLAPPDEFLVAPGTCPCIGRGGMVAGNAFAEEMPVEFQKSGPSAAQGFLETFGRCGSLHRADTPYRPEGGRHPQPVVFGLQNREIEGEIMADNAVCALESRRTSFQHRPYREPFPNREPRR